MTLADVHQVFEVYLADQEFAARVLKKYKEMYPEDDFNPELELIERSNGTFGYKIKVPEEYYVKFDCAFNYASL